jgi:hypothetical protein
MVQGCDAMVICFDPTKRATYEYAVSMLKKGVCAAVSSPCACTSSLFYVLEACTFGTFVAAKNNTIA